MTATAGVPGEFEFTLPRGLVDGTQVHRKGSMRLATAFDEVEPLKDPRVRANPGYLMIIVLARVITKLGELERVSTNTLETLYAADLEYLQDFYKRINQTGQSRFEVQCPHCTKTFEVETPRSGG